MLGVVFGGGILVGYEVVWLRSGTDVRYSQNERSWDLKSQLFVEDCSHQITR